MLSKCANPACSTAFQYLRDGKLFQIEVGSSAESGIHVVNKSPSRKIEFFWLCGPCSARLTLAYQRGKGVITLPLSQPARTAAAS